MFNINITWSICLLIILCPTGYSEVLIKHHLEVSGLDIHHYMILMLMCPFKIQKYAVGWSCTIFSSLEGRNT